MPFQALPAMQVQGPEISKNFAAGQFDQEQLASSRNRNALAQRSFGLQEQQANQNALAGGALARAVNDPSQRSSAISAAGNAGPDAVAQAQEVFSKLDETQRKALAQQVEQAGKISLAYLAAPPEMQAQNWELFRQSAIEAGEDPAKVPAQYGPEALAYVNKAATDAQSIGDLVGRAFPESKLLSPEEEAQKIRISEAGRNQQNINIGGGPQTKGQIKVDENFATEFNELVAGGGFADIDKGLEQLNEVVTALESGESLTGTFLGNLPDTVRAAINPESIDTQELVEEVVQRNLRIILGAQFTEKEGARLIARAYNPKLDEKTNAKRVRRLMDAIKKARDAKFASAEYFQENGTLTGFEGVQKFTIDDLAADADLPDTGKVEGIPPPPPGFKVVE